eukprot:TRINITY_DN1685_c0_g1_i1.p1 TRINITY_DN1685_c0_g1~~TRINITY_DN1685_c0_g1_i1.p1  ORF type:complete len:146 (+),score=47.24 TRINITY_DN1685_c0_g1_i1:69-506(+)
MGAVSSLLCSVVGVAYPTYASFKALESDGKDDDTQWLVYWVVYSVFSVIEAFADTFIFWVPFYYELKLLGLIALQFPQLRLAATLYESYIRPMLKSQERKIDSYVDETSKNLKKKVSDAVTKQGPAMMMAAMSAANSPPAETKKE